MINAIILLGIIPTSLCQGNENTVFFHKELNKHVLSTKLISLKNVIFDIERH